MKRYVLPLLVTGLLVLGTTYVSSQQSGPSGGVATSVASQAFPLLAPDGTAGAPSYAFSNSPGTGFWLATTNQVSVSTSGAQRWGWNNAGHYIAATDGAFDIGAAGQRPRNITIQGGIVVGSGAAVSTEFISLGRTTVGALPAAAAANAGRIVQVTDSTAVASEGQTCAPGGTTNALAFSTGTVWKCF